MENSYLTTEQNPCVKGNDYCKRFWGLQYEWRSLHSGYSLHFLFYKEMADLWLDNPPLVNSGNEVKFLSIQKLF